MSPEAAMPVLTMGERDAIARAFSDPGRVVVVALCAAWCDTCAQFRAGFERIAQARPQATFVWLDIEDDAEVAGDVEVENFPTLAIYRDRKPLHFGVSRPHETTVGRLVDALADSGQPLADAPDEVVALPGSFGRQ
jgi:thioredoxin reductase (NADPH)